MPKDKMCNVIFENINSRKTGRVGKRKRTVSPSFKLYYTPVFFILSFSVTSQDDLVLVMEFFDGKTLQEKVEMAERPQRTPHAIPQSHFSRIT